MPSKMSPTLTVSFVVVAILLFVHSTDSAFIINPVSVNTSLNSTVTFTCEAEAVVLLFYVNNTFAGSDAIGSKGFTQVPQVMVNATVVRRTMTVEARESNNNTNISCRTSPGDAGIESDIALLRIQGPLASVGDLKATVLNGGSSVQLTWTAPYTLDSVPISGYFINGQLVNTTEAILYSTDPVDPCTLTTSVVTAMNGAGEGEPVNISFYYQTVPQVIPPVSVVPSVSDRQVTLQVKVDVSQLCPGEYPTGIIVDILNTDGIIQLTASLQSVAAANGQLMMGNTSIAVPDNLITFIVNVSLSNEGGVFPTIPSFPFGFLGPVLNIDSSIDNCSIINITWNRPAVDEIVPILHYTLRIYDAVNGMLVRNVSSIKGTDYQFEDKELFRHRYTYVIAAVNELGEGESANGTFSYQRAPRSAVEDTVFDILMFAKDTVTLQFNIPITLECTGEAPENATVTVKCGTAVSFRGIYLVEYGEQPNITNNSTVAPKHQQCTLSITFSNKAGQSDPLTFTLSTFDVLSANVTVDENSICVVCQLSPQSEGCFVTVTGIDSSLTRNRPLFTVNSSATVQGCVDNLPIGTYTVLIYDVENGMPVFPATAAVNVTITTPLPSETPSSVTPLPLPLFIIIIIIVAVVAVFAVVIGIIGLITITCVLCIRKQRKDKESLQEQMTTDGQVIQLQSISTIGKSGLTEGIENNSAGSSASTSSSAASDHVEQEQNSKQNTHRNDAAKNSVESKRDATEQSSTATYDELAVLIKAPNRFTAANFQRDTMVPGRTENSKFSEKPVTALNKTAGKQEVEVDYYSTGYLPPVGK